MKELSRTREWSTRLSFIVILLQHDVLGTIDVNLNELEYLAARLNPFECRRLIVALHYTTYDLPDSLADAERNVDDEIPCIRHLLHWNNAPAEGKGSTHEILAHRLRQINRNDLADWLGKAAFKQLGKDLDRAVVKAFDELHKQETELPYPITLEPRKRHEEDPWLEVNVVLIAVLLGLLGTLLTLICFTIWQRMKRHFRKIRYEKQKQENDGDVKQEAKQETKNKRAIKSSSTADYVHLDSDTDTDTD